MEETNGGEKAMHVGGEKVVIVADTDLKTPMGSDIVEITFASGRKEKMPKKTYELVVTDVPSDPTIVHRTKMNSLIPAIKAVICEYDLKVGEIQSMLQQLANGIDDNFSRATNWLWTKDDEGYVPGMNPLSPRTLLEADAVIRSIPTKVEAPKPAELDGKVA
jgi:hypothetical protein